MPAYPQQAIAKMFRHSGKYACLLAVAALAACSSQQANNTAPAAPEAGKAAPAPTPEPPAKLPAWTVNGYKKDAAEWISSVNRKNLFEGAPPPILKSVVVLSIAVNANGEPTRVAVLRSNGYSELDKIAVQSVKSAAPLPHPSRLIMHGGGLEYTETWLFRDDGRFQIRTLAEPQSSGL